MSPEPRHARRPASEPIIRFERVSKTYPNGAVALNDINLSIETGAFTFLVGQSGSGKSTLLRVLTREEPATTGAVVVAGNHLSHLKPWHLPVLRRSIGCVFQDFKLLPNRTVHDNIAFALRVTGNKRHIPQKVPAILELVGLTHKANQYPDELSGGEQQRVSIARAFVNQPHILLCDEPTGNLDPVNTDGIMTLLDRINQVGTTVVMATHDETIVNSMRRRVIELSHGSIIRDANHAHYQPTGTDQ